MLNVTITARDTQSVLLLVFKRQRGKAANLLIKKYFLSDEEAKIELNKIIAENPPQEEEYD